MMNIFALGGLQITFLWIILLGLFWKKANSIAAIISLIIGISSYILFTLGSRNSFYFEILNKIFTPPFNTYPIVLPLLLSLIIMIGVSIFTKPPPRSVLEIFWGDRPGE